MPIKWSAVKVNEAMDMAEEFINQADEPLEQAKIVAREARRIADLPQYLDHRLITLITQIEKLDYAKDAIKAIRNDIPEGAIEAEQRLAQYGKQQSLV